MTIWKHVLEVTDYQTLSVPLLWSPLSVQEQAGRLCLWAITEEEQSLRRPVTVRIVGTGNPFPDAKACSYVGTVQLSGLVWHVFWKVS